MLPLGSQREALVPASSSSIPERGGFLKRESLWLNGRKCLFQVKKDSQWQWKHTRFQPQTQFAGCRICKQGHTFVLLGRRRNTIIAREYEGVAILLRVITLKIAILLFGSIAPIRWRHRSIRWNVASQYAERYALQLWFGNYIIFTPCCWDFVFSDLQVFCYIKAHLWRNAF